MDLTVSTQNCSSTEPTTSLQVALRQFEAALTQEQRQALHQNNRISELSDVVVFIAEIDAANQSRRLSVSSRLFTFLDAAQQFASVVDTFVSSNPAIAALVWGTIKASIIIANNSHSYFDKVTALITEIGRWSPKYAQFGRLYRNDPQTQAALCEYYAIIIRICTKIVQLHVRPSNAWSRLVSSFEADFKPLLDELDLEQKRLHVQMHLASQKVIHQSAQMIVEEHKIQKQHRSIVSRFQSSSSREQEQISRSIARQRRSQILENLSELKPREIWSMIHAQRVIGTAEWFMREPCFEAWYRSIQTSVLWCAGKLGVGKSILLASIIAYLEQKRSANHHISYHFCQTGSETTLTARGMLGSITRQLLTGVIDRLREDQIQVLSEKSRDASIEDMIDILEQYLEPSMGRSYFIILDGLDECLEDDLATAFRQLKRISQNPKFCVKLLYSCRPDLEGILSNSLMYDSKLNLTEEVLREDIKMYIDATLQRRVEEGKLKITDPKLLLKIAEVLDSRHNGMILWLVLFTDELCMQNSDDAILNALEHPPEGIRELYDQKISRIRSHKLSEDCVNVLQYAGVTCRPLTVEEMREALSISLDQRELDPTRLPNDMHRILRACRGLIHIDEGTDKLLYVHSSLYSHLFSKSEEPVDGFNYSENELHFVSICLTYFNFKNFTHQIIRAPKEGGQFNPVGAALAQTGLSKVLNSNLTQKLLNLRRAKSSISPQQLYSLLQQESPNQSFQFKFFDYVSEHWLQHTKDLRPAKQSQVWRIFHRCILNQNLNKWKPWLMTLRDEANYQNTANNLLKWALSHNHNALVLHQVLFEPSSIPYNSRFSTIRYIVKLGSEYATYITANWPLETNRLVEFASELLIDAVNVGDVETVKGCLAVGANINAAHVSQRTLLDWATGHRNVEIARLILNGEAQVSIVDVDGSTPLHDAASSGKTEFVKLLLAAGADINTLDTKGQTPLFKAVFETNIETVKILLTAGADSNIADEKGQTPLHKAVAQDLHDIVQVLVEAGANINACDEDKQTPLHKGVRERSWKSIAVLTAAGADINALNRRKQTPLFEAVSAGTVEVTKTLLAAGAGINIANARGLTPLHDAVNRDFHQIVQALLEAGADIDPRDKQKQTPLHKGAYRMISKSVQLLIAAGADINALDQKRQTPVHIAVSRRRTEIVDVLIAAGANLNIADESNETPLRMALRSIKNKVERKNDYGRGLRFEIMYEVVIARALLTAGAHSSLADRKYRPAGAPGNVRRLFELVGSNEGVSQES